MARVAAKGFNTGAFSLPLGDFGIVELAATQDGLITSPQLKQLGLRRSAIRYRVRVGRLHPIYPGVYAVGTPTLSPRGHLRAAILHYGPTALLSHRSAAAVWGIRATSQRGPDVMVPGSSRQKRPGINLHRARKLDPRDATSRDTLPITSLPRTALDIAAILPTPHLIRALEQADRLELLDLPALHGVCERYPSHPGKRTLRTALHDLTEPPRTRSELERDFLDAIRQAGLPEPLINTKIHGYEVDFYWPEQRLVVELDGFAYHKGRAAFERDRVKDTTLQRHDQRVMRVTHRRLADHLQTVIDDLTTLHGL